MILILFREARQGTMRSRMAIAAAPLLGLMLLGATEARAQCSFDSSVPADGEVVDAVPAPMTLNFSFAIDLQHVRLVGEDGAVWPLDWMKSSTDVYKAEFRATKPLPPGKYVIEWDAYVRQHYHPDAGSVPFTVVAAGSAAAIPAAGPPAGVAPRDERGSPYRALLGGSAPPAGR
jgi:methionine-rich copper-binding protein CopC